MSRRVVVVLTRRELSMLSDAIDSHCYWELTDSNDRNNGYVVRSNRKVKAFERLEAKLENAAPAPR